MPSDDRHLSRRQMALLAQDDPAAPLPIQSIGWIHPLKFRHESCSKQQVAQRISFDKAFYLEKNDKKTPSYLMCHGQCAVVDYAKAPEIAAAREPTVRCYCCPAALIHQQILGARLCKQHSAPLLFFYAPILSAYCQKQQTTLMGRLSHRNEDQTSAEQVSAGRLHMPSVLLDDEQCLISPSVLGNIKVPAGRTLESAFESLLMQILAVVVPEPVGRPRTNTAVLKLLTQLLSRCSLNVMGKTICERRPGTSAMSTPPLSLST